MGVSIYLCVVFCSASVINANILGKFIFHGDADNTNQKCLLSILHKPESVHLAPNAGPIHSDEVASVLSLSLGLSVPKDINWAGLQVSNPFNLPKAVVILSVDNLPKENELNLPSVASFPVDMGDHVASISDMYYISSKYTLSNHIAAVFDGQSKIVSVSADEKVASSGHSKSRLSATSIWSEKTDSWKLVTGDGEVHESLQRSQILKRIPDVLTSGFTYDAKLATVKVNVKGLEFSYNLENKVDFKLFSELVSIWYQHEEVASKKHEVRDNAKDLFMFSVSALKDIERKYGSDSKQMQGSLLLIQKMFSVIVKDFTKLYDGNIFIVGLTKKSELSPFADDEKDFQPVLKVLNDNNVAFKDFDHYSSELHIVDRLETEAQNQLCRAIQGSVSQLGKSLKFECANEMQLRKISRRSLLSYVTADEEDLNLASYYDDMFPVIFNIWFWLIVLLALTIYATSLALWNMDPGRDSIIYRLTQQKIKSG